MAHEKDRIPPVGIRMDDPYGDRLKPAVRPRPAVTDVDPFNPPRYETPLPEHVGRLSDECRDLIKRLQSLMGFIETKTFKELPTYKQAMLFDQKEQMEAYAKTLSLRYFMELLENGRD